jgi:hypothetical protein
VALTVVWNWRWGSDFAYPITPAARSRVTSSGVTPSAPRTASVCSPRAGEARWTHVGVADIWMIGTGPRNGPRSVWSYSVM